VGKLASKRGGNMGGGKLKPPSQTGGVKGFLYPPHREKTVLYFLGRGCWVVERGVMEGKKSLMS